MTILSVNARAQDGFTLGVAGVLGGETAFELEINRSADFTSDVSLIKSALPVGNVAVTGLPAGTIWFCRHRSTNLASPGAWSNTLLVATTAPNADPGYVGFSIAPAFLVVPDPVSNLVSPMAIAGAPASRLARHDPNSVMISTAAVVQIDFDTSGQPWDCIALLGTLLNEAATWRIRAANDRANVMAAPLYDSGVVQFRASANVGARSSYHGFHKAPAPMQYRFVSLTIVHAAPMFIARNLVCGLVRQTQNFARGASVQPLDLSQFSRTTIGTPNITKGWRGRQIQFGLSWLSESEYQAKWSDLEWRVGQSEPVLAVPNSKANTYFMDRMAYGVIASMDAENVRSSKFAKTLTISSIY